MSVQVKGSGTIGGLDEGLVVSGIVTSSTQINVGSNIKLGNAGVITATSFVGSGANLTSLPAQATISNNADDRVITGGSGVNLNGEQRLTFNSSNILTATETGTGNGMGGIRAATANAGGNAGYGFMTNSANRFAVTTIGSAGAESLRVYDDNNNAERLRITSGGLVGINQNTPTHMLHVDSSNASDSTATAFFKGRIIRFDGAASAHSPRLNFSLDGTDKATILLHRTNDDLEIQTLTASPIRFSPNSTERARITSDGDLKFNSGYGSVATAYGVRAWIAFKAASNANITRGSGNATMTDHGTGDFTMNFTTAMPDSAYCVVGSAGYNSGQIVLGLTGSGTHSSPQTSGFRFTIRANYNNASLMDEEYVNLMVVR